MTLIGTAERRTDFRQCFIGMSKQDFSFFQFCPHDELGRAETKFLPEQTCRMGTAVSDIRCNICHLNMVVYIMPDKLNAAYETGFYVRRKMDGSYFACIEKSGAAGQKINFFNGRGRGNILIVRGGDLRAFQCGKSASLCGLRKKRNGVVA